MESENQKAYLCGLFFVRARDRRALRRQFKAAKFKATLSEGSRIELDEESKALIARDNGAKFAIAKPQPQDGESNQQSLPTSNPTPEHHFPRCPKRLLSAGSAKRISPEELAIMLDSYNVQAQKTQRPQPDQTTLTESSEFLVRSPTRSVVKSLGIPNSIPENK
ncbi:unnamed protein product [Mesocestoides corti]|uniref:Uncharacterized protein n=1 Tax=Mesocestoides corti TaxID=53468 RepID=A0A0R3U2X6_MESCO|nr:unnamed protein product [Mesocestoides corti]